MTQEPTARTQGLHDLFEQSLDELDPAMQSPLYVELRSLEARYVLPELIAVGGMKRIIKVLDRQSNRYVAMARLHEDASDLLFDPFIREARLTALLEHPNVISVHDVGVDSEGQPFFTMELKVGDGLDMVLQKAQAGNAYPLSERLEIFLKVCDAITYAHSRGVIHLDIKPANIQVGQFGEVLVCDWGLGKMIAATEGVEDEVLLNPDLLNEMTMSGKVRGTPGYMAPEQISGGERDERTDIYALGALLYALLTCRPPLEGCTGAILDSALDGNIVPPSEIDSGIPESLSSIVMKAMALEPKDRYAAVSELVKDIRAFLAGRSPAAHESGLTTEILLFYRRNRAACNVAAVFLAVVFVVTASFVDRLGDKRSQAEGLAARLQVEKQESEALLREVGALATPFRTSVNDSQILSYGGQISNDFFFQAPLVSYKLSLHSVNEVIQTQPESRAEALGMLGYFYFMATDFEAAKPYLAADPERMNGLISVNQELIGLFDHARHKVSASELTKVINLVLIRLNRRMLADKILAYDFASVGYRQDYDRAVKAMYRTQGRDFDYASESQIMTIDGAGELSRLTTASNLSPLRFLPIKQLILVDTLIASVSELQGLELAEVVDLRGSRIESLPDLKFLPHLKVLIVRPGQLSADEVTTLSAQFQVEERGAGR